MNRTSNDSAVVVTGTLVAAVSVAYLGLLSAPLAALCSSSTLAAWVQAIGSVAAIVAAAGVALWQTFSERRLRRSQEKAAAQVIGSGILLTLPPILGRLQALDRDLLDHLNASTFQIGQVIQVAQNLGAAPALQHSDLLVLAHVMPECATQLARGHYLVMQFGTAVDAARGLEQVKAMMEAWHHAQQLVPLAIQQYQLAYEALDKFCE